MYAVAINPADNTMAASGGGDDIAYIWRTTDGSLLHKLTGVPPCDLSDVFYHGLENNAITENL